MKAKLAIALVLFAVIAFGSWLAVPYLGIGTSKPLPPDVAKLQLLAEEACLCQQQGQKADCDSAYKQATSAYEVTNAESACAPIGTSSDIIQFDGKEFWITTGYHVVANLPEGMSAKLCRRVDAQAVEAAYANGFGPRIDTSKPTSDAELMAKDRAANAALVKALEAIRRGERPSSKSNSGGCA